MNSCYYTDPKNNIASYVNRATISQIREWVNLLVSRIPVPMGIAEYDWPNYHTVIWLKGEIEKETEPSTVRFHALHISLVARDHMMQAVDTAAGMREAKIQINTIREIVGEEGSLSNNCNKGS